ncbi:hypothetical protein AMK59_1655, partial [Oryctes borbonicus]
DEKKFTSPGKKRQRTKSVRSLPECQIKIVRDMIYDFHRIDERRVTVSALRQKMHDELEWKGSNASVRRILTDLGFKFRCTQNNRKVLIERLAIVYIDETYIHSSHTSSKMWRRIQANGILIWDILNHLFVHLNLISYVNCLVVTSNCFLCKFILF